MTSHRSRARRCSCATTSPLWRRRARRLLSAALRTARIALRTKPRSTAASGVPTGSAGGDGIFSSVPTPIVCNMRAGQLRGLLEQGSGGRGVHSAVPGGAESRSPGASRFEVPSLWLGPSVMYIEAAVAFTKSPDFSLGAPVRAEALKPSWNIGDNDPFRAAGRPFCGR